MADRVHVVRHNLDAWHESWGSPDGAMFLLRDVGQTRWRAVLDLVVVTDAHRLQGGLLLEGEDANLEADDPQALADMLAKQERVHVIFDA